MKLFCRGEGKTTKTQSTILALREPVIISLHLSNKRQSKVELANEEILVRGVGSILD
jgi:hypothetical protein